VDEMNTRRRAAQPKPDIPGTQYSDYMSSGPGSREGMLHAGILAE